MKYKARIGSCEPGEGYIDMLYHEDFSDMQSAKLWAYRTLMRGIAKGKIDCQINGLGMYADILETEENAGHFRETLWGLTECIMQDAKRHGEDLYDANMFLADGYYCIGLSENGEYNKTYKKYEILIEKA